MLADCNERFSRKPASCHDALRPIRDDEDPGRIFTWQEERKLSKNRTLRAQLVTDAVEIERVTAAFETKYGGFMSWFSGLIRGAPRIFRLSAPGP